MLKMFGFFVADDSVSLLKNSQSIIICSSNKKREIYLTWHQSFISSFRYGGIACLHFGNRSLQDSWTHATFTKVRATFLIVCVFWSASRRKYETDLILRKLHRCPFLFTVADQVWKTCCAFVAPVSLKVPLNTLNRNLILSFLQANTCILLLFFFFFFRALCHCSMQYVVN